MKRKNIIVLLGPNLDMTGIYEKSIYGEETIESIKSQIIARGETFNLNCEVFQSNWEGALIDKLHDTRNNFDGGIINPGALCHYSYALRDAISSIRVPFVEVHMTNIYSREEFRRHSVIADVCVGQIVGLGKNSYFLSLEAIKELI